MVFDTHRTALWVSPWIMYLFSRGEYGKSKGRICIHPRTLSLDLHGQGNSTQASRLQMSEESSCQIRPRSTSRESVSSQNNKADGRTEGPLGAAERDCRDGVNGRLAVGGDSSSCDSGRGGERSGGRELHLLRGLCQEADPFR